MPDEPLHYADDDLFNPQTKHEQSDVPIRPLFWGIAIFVLFGIFTHFVIWFMFRAMAKGERNRDLPPLSAVARPENASVPQNQPLLQPFPRKASAESDVIPPYRTTPVTDLGDMIRSQDEALNSYGWVDREKGIARIPIERAIELTAQRGLPRASAPAAAPAAPTPNAPANAPQAPPAAPAEGEPNAARIPAGGPGAH